jgi:hypothetical protein
MSRRWRFLGFSQNVFPEPTKMISPPIRELARRAVSLEAARAPSASEALPGCAQARVKLQGILVDLVGIGGYCSLVSRALSIAGGEAPALRDVELDRHGCPQGLEQVGGASQAEIEEVLLAHILGLLVTLLGADLTLSLARRAWPAVALDQTDHSGEGKS